MVPAIPTPRGFGFVNGLRFGLDPLGYVERMQAQFEDAARIPLPFRGPLVIVTNQALVHEALSRPGAFTRPPTLEAVRLIAEHGLVQSEGDRWQRQRAVMTSGFSGDRVTQYAETTGTGLAELAERWRTLSDSQVNLHRELSALTLRAATEILLGVEMAPDRAREFYDWMQVAGRQFEFGLSTVAPAWVPRTISKEFRTTAGDVRGLSEKIIETRRSRLDGESDPPDVLGRLLVAAGGPEPRIPPDNLVDHVATLLIAGHETTALSVGYALSLLSWHPEEQNLVCQEAKEVLGSEQPARRHVDDLVATRRVYDEALRLYPPAWAVFRRATGDGPLGEYVVGEGAAVVLPQWSIHRDGRYFDEPERFVPDRWEGVDPTQVDAYFPFASGTHACIGRQFAITGGPLAIAALLKDFEITVPEDALDDLRVTPTLRPVDGIAATIQSR